ncbi:hypothetical protein OWR29_33945 [Actinoplanes sp. Pm04-4]|uniref:Uncharacterized protein n=1 Tax=Paractinoplanes pyxinae TaxID=2997416 RepID=A0ABT4B951_9ACTN|nr:hypothetical protein [Actinoplanes pyxinae]MCY1143024.1 hypothetical protein [Actinoplanes pyxinae]
MAQRIKDLLDEAVSGVEPRTLDPAAAVARRRRAQQRRRLVAGTFAVLGVLAGGALAVPQFQRDSSPPPVSVIDRPLPVPHFADGVLVSGGLRLPVPPGWQGITGGRDRSCADPDRTILIPDTTGDPENSWSACPRAVIRVVVEDGEMRAPAGAVMTDDGLVMTPPISLTLPGGEPAWVSNRISEADTSRGDYDLQVVLPWSRTTVYLGTSLAETRQILGSIRTEPVDAGRLIVPDVPAVAELIASDPADPVHPLRGKTTETTKLFEIVRVLQDQRDPVPDSEACAGPEQPGMRLDIGTAHVVITLGGKCQEAVSSQGGRVRFDDDAVAELKQIFGIER